MAAYEYWRVQVQFTAGVWTEVTSDVDGPLRATNGATPETTGETASLSLVLHNPGFKYTPGNTTSATALATGMPIRFFEVISDQYIYHFTGFVEFPEVGSVNLSMTQTQKIAVSAIDQLSAWERSPTLISPLVEHIRYTGGASLQFYLPAAEVVGPTLSDPRQGFTVTETKTFVAGEIVSLTAPLVSYGATPGPDDEITAVAYTPALTSGSLLGRWASHSTTSLFSTLVVDSGKSIAIAMWVNFQSVPSTAFNTQLLTISGPAGSYLQLGLAGATATWLPIVEDFSGITGPLNGGSICTDAWRLIALRLTEPSGLVEFWNHGADPVTTTIAGATQGQFWQLKIQGQSDVAVAHMQVYYGEGAYPRSQHLAQVRGDWRLERQTTGDRIKTLGRYAGLTDGQLANVDTGSSIMQPARLAGLTTAQAMYEARDTEQGDLYVDGTGALTFHDRRTILNI